MNTTMNKGVGDVDFKNDIIKPQLSSDAIESDIHAALKRSAVLDADEVTVSTSGNRVTFSGDVRTYAEKEEADRTAWAAAGVMSVDNKLTVDWSWLSDSRYVLGVRLRTLVNIMGSF